MPTFTYTIRDKLGIHARPAGLIVNKVKELGCPVKLLSGDKGADASRLFSVMAMGLKYGDTVTVEVDGSEEQSHLLESFLKENL